MTRVFDLLGFAFVGFLSCFFGASTSLFLLRGIRLQRAVLSSSVFTIFLFGGLSSSLSEEPLSLDLFLFIAATITGDTLRVVRSLSESLDSPCDLPLLPSSLVVIIAFERGAFFFGLLAPLARLRALAFFRFSSAVR